MVAEVTVGLYLEDAAHERFMTALIERAANEVGVDIELATRNATGGIPRMRRELRRFLAQRSRVAADSFDILIIAEDTDCRGEIVVRNELTQVTEQAEYPGATIIATPAPHIECWYLADPAAVQIVSGEATLGPIPTGDCEKDVYKRRLGEAFPDALQSGIEYAADIVSEMNIYQAGRNVRSLGNFLDQLRATLTRLRGVAQ